MIRTLTLTLLLSAVTPSPPSPDVPRRVRADVPFEMAIGDRAVLPSSESELHFVDVPSDSRCPVDVTCIWAGDAVVRLALESADDAVTEIELHTAPGKLRETPIEGRFLSLLALSPEPSTSHPIEKKDYRARLVLRDHAESPPESK